MYRVSRAILVVGLLAAGIGCGAGGDDDSIDLTPVDIEATARAIHDSVITIDTHDDIPSNFATAEVDPGVRGDRQVDLPKMREGGLDVAFFVVYVGQGDNDAAGYADAYRQAMQKFDAIHRLTEQMDPDQIELAYSAADVERIHAAGKLVAAIGIENGWPVGEDLGNLKTFHDLGGRYVTLAHNGHNQIADSANPRASEPDERYGGISDFGAQVIAEMNRVGIMVDVSHISKKAMLEAVGLSQAPVIASHSACRALCDVARNMDDEQLQALADNGGVIQIVAVGAFVKADPPRAAAIDTLVRDQTGMEGQNALFAAMSAAPSAARRADLEAQWAAVQARIKEEIDPTYPPPDVEDFVDHIDHAVQLIGIDHVGISSDFDGGGGIQGWNNAAETFNVTLALVRRGYSEQDIRQLWGSNTLRVWRQAEEVSERLQRGDQ